MSTARILSTACLAGLAAACAPSEEGGVADRVAEYAAATYGEAAEATLADLVAFQTVHRPDLANADHPEFRAMTAYLSQKAAELGLELQDFGSVVVVALGQGDERLGVVTHGDVQPADAAKWAEDPFRLDRTSEPGRLVGRGVEDDKGPIAAALYAMTAVKDRGVPLRRRVELIVSYTEESDWGPFQSFLAAHPPPELNVVIDAEYPVVTAEKGWGEIRLTLPPVPAAPEPAGPRLVSFNGGAFLSQVPEDARAVIAEPTAELEAALRAAAGRIPHVRFRFAPEPGVLRVEAKGTAFHSSKPWAGTNAITHLAALLAAADWPDGQAARMVRLVNDLVGTGNFADRFGRLAYAHEFMGSLTLTLATLEERDGRLVAGINIRRPAGRSGDEVEAAAREAVTGWQRRTGFEVEVETRIFDPYYPPEPPHVPVLLDIYRRHTGSAEAEPLAIGGGTQARLLPNAVNFGPAVPGSAYTGHSEHEYMERSQFLLNLRMYAAMLVELAGG